MCNVVNMNSLFSEKEIEINCGDKGRLGYTMRPLTVSEFIRYVNFVRKHREYPTEKYNEYLLELIAIIGKTLTPDIGTIPEAALQGLIEIFIEYNFPKDVRRKSDNAGDLEDYDMARAVDFLINQGHLENGIMEYPLPRFRVYIEAASDRLTGKTKKKEDILSVFVKMGVPIARGGNNGN